MYVAKIWMMDMMMLSLLLLPLLLLTVAIAAMTALTEPAFVAESPSSAGRLQPKQC